MLIIFHVFPGNLNGIFLVCAHEQNVVSRNWATFVPLTRARLFPSGWYYLLFPLEMQEAYSFSDDSILYEFVV